MDNTEEPSNRDDEPTAEPPAQDPFVERFRPDPAAPPTRFLTVSGLAGRSDRPGYRRLYTTRSLDKYLEFRAEDVLHEEHAPADADPMRGLESTILHLRRDATIDQVTPLTGAPADEFDLDLRIGPAAGLDRIQNPTWGPDCTIGTDCGGGATDFGLTCAGTCGETCQITICRGRTCVDIDTCLTCRTCRTDCNQATCATCNTQCNQATCATCNQATCATCNTQCNQATCATCNQATCATCNQATCATCLTECTLCPTDFGRTCPTANPHVFTCGARC